jgi:DNA-binding XRE family transcriptional regulator
MADRAGPFGVELRRRRAAAGVSLGQLAGLIHYSKGYLSKIETGEKPPTRDLARRCDAALEAGGQLAGLVSAGPARAPTRPTRPTLPQPTLSGPVETADPAGSGPPEPAEVWAFGLDPDGGLQFRPGSPRGSGQPGLPLLSIGLSPPAVRDDGGRSAALELFDGLFDQYRLFGHQASPALVLPALAVHTHVLRTLAGQAEDPQLHRRLLLLAARYAEYTGWMAQEAGNEQAAMWWTDTAVRLAVAGGYRELAWFIRCFRGADIALYRDDAAQTIHLARQAQVGPGVAAGIRALAMEREAQGHALAGDYDACLSTLDRAAELPSVNDSGHRPAFGTTSLSDPIAVITAWSLHDLGRPARAAEILDREVPRIPAVAVRSCARYGVRQALAHCAAGDVDRACELATRLIPDAERVDSATIGIDLRRLARSLARWHSYPPVRELYPRLTAALHRPTTP